MARTTAYSGGNRQHAFSQVPSVSIKRSTFDRSSNYKTTFNSGRLVPFFVEEILPGDTLKLSTNIFARLATPITVLMDNIWLEFFFFFVPNRLVWDKWAFFMGEEEAPGDAELPPKYGIPQLRFQSGDAPFLSNADYLGLPPDIDPLDVSALPFRCINLIWNEWFRDENLQTRLVQRKDGGVLDGSGNVIRVDSPGDFPNLRRGKRHDYFTSCLPWPQKGPTVLLPIGSTAPVVPETQGAVPRFHQRYNPGTGSFYSERNFNLGFENQPLSSNDFPWTTDITNNTTTEGPANQPGSLRWTDPALVADLTSASAATINELRQAFQVQRLLERDARGGTRLTELIRSHFGVVSPDARLQRPEYLGGGSVPVQINPVPQTTPGGAGDTPLAYLSAFGTAAGQGGGFSQSFTEHGHVIGFVAARADLNYQQGVQRFWNRKSRFDFYWPALQAIGEQAVLQKEIFFLGDAQEDEKVFGYQERWAEYRYRPNMITGLFRSAAPQSLDIWHLAQEFTEAPTLSAEFIEDNPPIDRVVAVPSEPEFLMDAFFRIKHTRPMPVYSVPGMIDHF